MGRKKFPTNQTPALFYHKVAQIEVTALFFKKIALDLPPLGPPPVSIYTPPLNHGGGFGSPGHQTNAKSSFG